MYPPQGQQPTNDTFMALIKRALAAVNGGLPRTTHLLPTVDIGLNAATPTVVMTLPNIAVKQRGMLYMSGMICLSGGVADADLVIVIALTGGPTAFTRTISDHLVATQSKTIGLAVQTDQLTDGTYGATITITATTSSSFKASGNAQSTFVGHVFTT